MNLQILFSIVLFVVFSLVSYDAWHAKRFNKQHSVFFSLCAVIELVLLFVNLEIIK